MNRDLKKIIRLMKHSEEDIYSLKEKGYDFLKVLSAANWIMFSEEVKTESIRYFSPDEFSNISEDVKQKLYEVIYSDKLDTLKKENFIDIITGFCDIKADIPEEEIDNIVKVIFEDKVV